MGAVTRAAAGATGMGPVTRVLGTLGRLCGAAFGAVALGSDDGRGAEPAREAGLVATAAAGPGPEAGGRCSDSGRPAGRVTLAKGGASKVGWAAAVGRGAAAAWGGALRGTASTPDQRAIRSAAANCCTSSATCCDSVDASASA
jgi:hypothetical protein